MQTFSIFLFQYCKNKERNSMQNTTTTTTNGSLIRLNFFLGWKREEEKKSKRVDL